MFASVALFGAYLLIKFLPQLDLQTVFNCYFWYADRRRRPAPFCWHVPNSGWRQQTALLTGRCCCTCRLIGSIAIIGTLAAPLRQLVMHGNHVMSLTLNPLDVLCSLSTSLLVLRQRDLIGMSSSLICQSGWQRTKTGSPSGAFA